MPATGSMGRSSAAALATGALLLALGTGPAHAACRAVPIATVPLAENWNFLVLPATIAGQPVSMLLDSGADAGLVTEEAASRLHLRRLDGRTTLQGTGPAAVTAPAVLLPELTLGDLVLPPHPVPVAPLPTEPRVTPPVAGLLGADLLANFDVDVDLPGKRLTLLRLAGACDGFRPWEGAEPVPVARDGDRLLVQVSLDGHALRGLIDTGARSTILDADSAARIGLTPAILAGDPGGVSGGLDLHPVVYRWHRFATLAIGGTTLTGPVVTVAPVNQPVDLLLGADFFAARRVWLSYATGRMFIGPPRSAPGAAASAR